MRSLAALGLLLALATPAAAQDVEAEAPAVVVERIEIRNNQFLQKETLLFYVSTKPGDRFDERRLREDFRRLWDTGFLEDLSLEAYDGPNGKVVVFTLAERKLVDMGEHQRLRDTRLVFQYATIREFCEPVERITGRTVRSFHSSTDTVVDGLSVETFIFYPEGEEGPSRGSLAG